MILYIPQHMQSSQQTHTSNIDVFIKACARSTTFANKTFHAIKQPTQGWKLDKYA
jgi:hypothetical protein